MLESSYEPIESEGNGGSSAQATTDANPDALRSKVNKAFIVSKLFYFFFYTALGSLFPFFSLYYRQLWLNAWQIGVLLALRPAVKIVCLPLWKMVTDKYSKPKVVYFISMFGWIIGYYGQSFIYPSDMPCYAYTSSPSEVPPGGRYINITPTPFVTLPPTTSVNFHEHNTSKREVAFIEGAGLEGSKTWDPRKLRVRKSGERIQDKEKEPFGGQMVGDKYAKITEPLSAPQSHLSEHGNEVSEAKTEHEDLVLGRESKRNNVVNEEDGTGLPFKDNDVTENPETTQPWLDPFPYPSEVRKSPKPPDDFRVRFNLWIFRTLIVIVILTEIITTPTPMLADSAVVRALVDSDSEYGRQRLFGSLGLSVAAILVTVWVTHDTNCIYTDTINYLPCFYVFEIAIGGTLIVSLFFTFEKPNGDGNGSSLMDGLKLFTNFKNGVFLATLFLFGYSHSLQIAFLFWYLQDLGGTPALFAIIILVYCFAEVVMYFISPYVVDMIGQHGMISMALACYTARFLMYSYLNDPWLVIPMEVVQGVTYGGVWSIAAVYVDAPQEASSLIQSILHFTYWGVGMALGAVVSGGIIYAAGARPLFLAMAGVCFVTCLFHVIIDIYNKIQSLEEEDEQRRPGARGKPKKEKRDRFIGAAAAPMVPCLLYGK